MRMQSSLNRLLLIAVVWQDSHSVHAAKTEREIRLYYIDLLD